MCRQICSPPAFSWTQRKNFQNPISELNVYNNRTKQHNHIMEKQIIISTVPDQVTFTECVRFGQFKTFPSLRCPQIPYMEQNPSAYMSLYEIKIIGNQNTRKNIQTKNKNYSSLDRRGASIMKSKISILSISGHEGYVSRERIILAYCALDG